jgi:hypothetical protein
MECVRSGAALEREKVRRYRIGILFCGGVMMAPLLASGHGVEFLLTRLELLPGRVRVEVTADCEGNLMLPDREAARAAIQRLFVVGSEGGAERKLWTELAPLRFESRTQLDVTAPLPPDPTWTGRAHDLLTGIWEWQPAKGERFQLAVPQGEPMDTLLWRVEAGAAPGAEVKWKIMITGDETEWLEPVAVGWGGWMVAGWVSGVVLVLGGVWGVVRRRRFGFLSW